MDGYMVSHSLPMEKNGEVRGHGMNFACGRTGVFDTLVNAPNMATQINLFNRSLRRNSIPNVTLSHPLLRYPWLAMVMLHTLLVIAPSR
ncbi:hypothetical protein CK203_102385 [Vitis vinifera]|uniref:Uncharacterized protein n=1 Tax=Vitis vinifera TaxID=29760 RepID=A0A438DNJ0_VITVI|nr:hypothetical protein CK203_102385 [Vitis vinifera]